MPSATSRTRGAAAHLPCDRTKVAGAVCRLISRIEVCLALWMSQLQASRICAAAGG
jgi:hypothetical protein